MAFYRICPRCGAALDPGEKCDCEREALTKVIISKLQAASHMELQFIYGFLKGK